MLATLFPKAAPRYTALPLFGPVIDGFDDWLQEQGYTDGSRRYELRGVVRMDQYLRRQGIRRVQDLTSPVLQRCWRAMQRPRPAEAGAAHTMERFLTSRGLLKPSPSPVPSAADLQLAAYSEHLRTVRGFSSSTLHNHCRSAAAFLSYLRFEKDPRVLTTVAARDLEGFLGKAAQRASRGTLQHTVAEVRGFLRFLVITGQIRPGLESQIDTPRCYRLEQLPRALPWETVRAFLDSIPRKTPLGWRDYAMFFLIVTYGLRCSEVVSLTLDDIGWRARRIDVPQTKTRRALELPLTDAVAGVLIEYLRKVQRPAGYRHLFLRLRAPIGTLKPTAVTEAFQAWSKRSGLRIPFQGAHCLRHSYAVHLLRQGTSLKAIGDLLGHRSAESTTVYLRLATEDLRGVGLAVPGANAGTEVQP